MSGDEQSEEVTSFAIEPNCLETSRNWVFQAIVYPSDLFEDANMTTFLLKNGIAALEGGCTKTDVAVRDGVIVALETPAEPVLSENHIRT